MFKEWGFLLTEMWVLLVLSALVGLFAGWLFWGRRAEAGASQEDVVRLRARLSVAEKLLADSEARHPPETPEAADETPAGTSRPRPPSRKVDEPVPADPGPIDVKPLGLDAPRDGIADDLKHIKGIGPKLERMCYDMGFFHFDQIADWTEAEIAWVDDNLEGFKGRVTRDQWVSQAQSLARGEDTDFSRKVDKGDLY